MVLATLINVVLAVAVFVMVVTPLALAIRTQHRDHHPSPAAAPSPAEQAPDLRPGEPGRRGSQPAYKPVVGRT